MMQPMALNRRFLHHQRSHVLQTNPPKDERVAVILYILVILDNGTALRLSPTVIPMQPNCATPRLGPITQHFDVVQTLAF